MNHRPEGATDLFEDLEDGEGDEQQDFTAVVEEHIP
jgi:hypothetical protein